MHHAGSVCFHHGVPRQIALLLHLHAVDALRQREPSWLTAKVVAGSLRDPVELHVGVGGVAGEHQLALGGDARRRQLSAQVQATRAFVRAAAQRQRPEPARLTCRPGPPGRCRVTDTMLSFFFLKVAASIGSAKSCELPRKVTR